MIDMMKNPAKEKKIVWDDLITVETVYPPIENMLSEGKYNQVNDDIRAGIGMPEVLLNGTAGNFSNSFLSVKTLMERLETGRQILLNWIKGQVELIAEALGFQKPAWIKLEKLSLNDEEVEKRFLLELVDRNMLSAQTLIERGGENFEIEVQRMKEEDKLRKQIREDNPFVLRKLGKFGPQLQDSSILELTDDMTIDPNTMAPIRTQKKNELPTGQEDKGQNGGRPQGVPRDNRRTTPKAPKGQNASASIIESMQAQQKAEFQFDQLFSFFTNSVLKSRNSNDLDDLDLSDFSKIYNSIIKVICHGDGLKRISKQQVANILQGQLSVGGAKLERCVRSVVQQRVKKFRERNKKAPSEKKMKEFTSSAFAICRSQGLK
jgi:hypothetical protein